MAIEDFDIVRMDMEVSRSYRTRPSECLVIGELVLAQSTGEAAFAVEGVAVQAIARGIKISGGITQYRGTENASDPNVVDAERRTLGRGHIKVPNWRLSLVTVAERAMEAPIYPITVVGPRKTSTFLQSELMLGEELKEDFSHAPTILFRALYYYAQGFVGPRKRSSMPNIDFEAIRATT